MRPPGIRALAVFAAFAIATTTLTVASHAATLLPPRVIDRTFPVTVYCPIQFDMSFIADGPDATLRISTTTVNFLDSGAQPQFSSQHLDNLCVSSDTDYQLHLGTLTGSLASCNNNAPPPVFRFDQAGPLPLKETFSTDPAARGWDLAHGAAWNTTTTAPNDPTDENSLSPLGDLLLGAFNPALTLTDSAFTTVGVHSLTAGQTYHVTGWWNASNFDQQNEVKLTVSVSSGTTTTGTNLIGNGSFETNLKGWNGYDHATLARVAGGQDGAFAVQVTGPTPGVEEFGLNDSPSWITNAGPAGTQYRISAYVRSATSTSPIKMRIREYKNRVRVGSRVYSAIQALTTSWQPISMDYTTLASGTSLDFQIIDVGKVAGDVFLIDNVRMEQIAPGASTALSLENPTPATPLVAGADCDVTWSESSGVPVDYTVVNASTDAGATWSVVGTATGTNQFHWTLPDAPTANAALFVQSYAGGVVVGDAVSDLLNIQAPATGVGDGLAPRAAWLAIPQPTPFRNRTMLAYGVPKLSRVRLQVFDLGGRLVRTLVDGIEAPGAKSIAWTGGDDRDAPVGAGVYLIRLNVGGEVRVQRAVRLR